MSQPLISIATVAAAMAIALSIPLQASARPAFPSIEMAPLGQVTRIEVAPLGQVTRIEVAPLAAETRRLEIERIDWQSNERIVLDYSAAAGWDWVPIEPGLYRSRVLGAIDGTNEPTARDQQLYYVPAPRATQSITPTPHPLVVIYSATVRSLFEPSAIGACINECRVRIVATPNESDLLESAVELPLLNTRYASISTPVAGLVPDSAHLIHAELLDGDGVELDRSTPISHVTPGVDFERPPLLLDYQAPAAQPFVDPFIIMSELRFGQVLQPFAYGLDGSLRWYDPTGTTTALFDLLPGGRYLAWVDQPAPSTAPSDLVMRDLVGRDLRRISVERANVLLAEQGASPILGFHHDAIELPDGRIAALAYVAENAATGDDAEARLIVGDAVLVFDDGLDLVWAWNAFDHLDTNRVAVLGEPCVGATPGCPALAEGVVGEDWLHSNSLAYDDRDGNLMLSVRHLDWLVKFDFANGTGDGHVVWRLGADGDFALEGAEQGDWFSHSHDAKWLADGRIILFDNGTTACEQQTRDCESRGQVWRVDEDARVATPEVNVGLGVYASALGASQQLSDGGFYWTAGFVFAPEPTWLFEADPQGEERSTLAYPGFTYRSYRTPGLILER